MTTSNWIKLTPPPALPAPYDGEYYWVQFLQFPNPAKVRYNHGRKWVDDRGHDYSEFTPIAYQPYNEPEPYVESE
jgi:hypothetical protein